jgi:hypothetical protein
MNNRRICISLPDGLLPFLEYNGEQGTATFPESWPHYSVRKWFRVTFVISEIFMINAPYNQQESISKIYTNSETSSITLFCHVINVFLAIGENP